MPIDRRRAAARRRAWGRGPMVLRFEPLEGRELLATTAVALPDLTAVQFDTLAQMDWGDSFQARGEILNQGDATASVPFHVNLYASTTPALGSQSVLLGRITIPEGLRPGDRVPFSQTVNLPATPPAGLGPTGTVYLGLLVDPEGSVVERNESNNSGNGQGLDTTAVTIVARLPSALAATSLGVYPDQVQWGQTVRVNAQIQNGASGDAPPTRARVVLTPSGSVPGGNDDVTIGNLQVPAVPAGQTVVVSQAIDLPSVPPFLLVGKDQFLLSVSQDADFVADPFSPHRATRGPGIDMVPILISSPTALTVDPNTPLPDLVAGRISAPTIPLAFGRTFQVTTTIQNQGRLDSGPYRVRFLMVGTDGSPETAMFLADATLEGLKAGYGQDVVQTLRLPGRLPLGASVDPNAEVRIAVLIDPENVFDESSKANNYSVSDVVGLQVVGTDGLVTVPTPAPRPVTVVPPSQVVRVNPQVAPRAQATIVSARQNGLMPPRTPRATTTSPTGSPARLGTPAQVNVSRRQFGPRAPRTRTPANLRIFPGGRQLTSSNFAGTP
ncbi:MAG: CARDB domain-containing protein [Isosphaeraceae bacterium]